MKPFESFHTHRQYMVSYSKNIELKLICILKGKIAIGNDVWVCSHRTDS
jgi:hypothetical protein